MTEAWRVATSVPWDSDQSPDWGQPFDSVHDAVAEVMKRARKHRGSGYRIRERGEAWGPVRTFKNLDEHLAHRIGDKTFKTGNVLLIQSQNDMVRWLVREIDRPPVIMDIPDGNNGIDKNHTLIFRDHADLHRNAESWGILNKRFIDGTSTWSQHAPWRPDNCTSNAEDFHAPSLDAMKAIARDIIDNGTCSKILLAGSEWLPVGGWRFVGSFIGHYDHAHIEPLPVRTGVC